MAQAPGQPQPVGLALAPQLLNLQQQHILHNAHGLLLNAPAILDDVLLEGLMHHAHEFLPMAHDFDIPEELLVFPPNSETVKEQFLQHWLDDVPSLQAMARQSNTDAGGVPIAGLGVSDFIQWQVPRPSSPPSPPRPSSPPSPPCSLSSTPLAWWGYTVAVAFLLYAWISD